LGYEHVLRSCVLAGAGRSWGKDVEAVQQQLQYLNAENKEVADELKAVFAELVKASASGELKHQADIYEQLYNDLKAEEAKLDERCKALEAKLPAGECTIYS
jgi:cytochrome c556